jgi:CRP/FNR family transcriptional regulator
MPDATPSNHPCGKCAFFAQSVWQPAGSGTISVLSRGFSRGELGAGETLFNQGDENRGVYCVSKGLIALRTLHTDGMSTLLRLAYPGEIIGFRSFLGLRDHNTEARALRPSRICMVARRSANQVVQGNPEVLMRLASSCIAEIDRTHERIIATATTSNKQRLADLLYRLLETHGERIEGVIFMQLPLSRSDLADLIGVQPETLSRLIKRLETDGLFHFCGREVRIPADGLQAQSASR